MAALTDAELRDRLGIARLNGNENDINEAAVSELPRVAESWDDERLSPVIGEVCAT
jgi:hypothetical protein